MEVDGHTFGFAVLLGVLLVYAILDLVDSYVRGVVEDVLFNRALLSSNDFIGKIPLMGHQPATGPEKQLSTSPSPESAAGPQGSPEVVQKQ